MNVARSETGRARCSSGARLSLPAAAWRVNAPGTRSSFSRGSGKMETANFGSVLREARERRSISLADVARKTKLSRSSLELLEAGELDALPAEVFVRGFIRS